MPSTLRHQTGLYGSIEFSLKYSGLESELTVSVIRCRGLRPMDNNGLSDPYVVLGLIPSHKSHQFRTLTVHKNLNPEFHQQFTFEGVRTNELDDKSLGLVVMDYDLIGCDDFIGGVKIPLYEVRCSNEVTLTRLLSGESMELSLLGEQLEERGRVLLTFSFADDTLKVLVKKAINLIPLVKRGSVSPYVKCLFLSGGELTKMKTRIIPKTLNPEYEEELSFHTLCSNLSFSTLNITVCNHNKVSKNAPIGEVTIGSKLFWTKIYDRQHTEWFTLRKPTPH